jgi:hypothetical protein
LLQFYSKLEDTPRVAARMCSMVFLYLINVDKLFWKLINGNDNRGRNKETEVMSINMTTEELAVVVKRQAYQTP